MVITVSKTRTVIYLLLLALIVIRFWDPTPVAAARASLFDFYQRVSPRPAEKLPVSIIDIDEKSLSELGQWPWPRSKLAELIDKLFAFSPSVIGLDFVFPEADRLSPANLIKSWGDDGVIVDQLLPLIPDYDQQFANSIKGKPIILGRMLQNTDETQSKMAGIGTDSKFHFRGGRPLQFIPNADIVVGNLPELEKAAAGIGILTLLPEPDGIVRRVPTLQRVGENVFPSFGVEVLRVALQSEQITVNSDAAGIDSLDIGGIAIPTDSNGLTWIYFNDHRSERNISASDVLQNRLDPDTLTGHIVLIGTSAIGLYDIKPTPMGGHMPGVEIWGQWLESVLFDQPLKRPNYIFVAELIELLLVCVMMIWLVSIANARNSLLAFVAVSAASISLSWWLFQTHRILFDFSFPLFSGGTLFTALVLLNLWKEERNRKQIRNAFSHYLSPALVDDLAVHPEHLRLSGENRNLTSLFTDLEGFTELSEKVQPGQLVDTINRYLDGMCNIAIYHGGTIDKIIGDALHIIFGAPHEISDHPKKAITCAIEMENFSQSYYEEVIRQGGQFGLTRIGVNTGDAVVGNFGGSRRLVYTAYGDTINIASRLEGVNKYLGTRICVAEETMKRCPDQLFRPAAEIIVKGKSKVLAVFEPVIDESQISHYLNDYLEAYHAMKENKEPALELFATLANTYPDDGLVQLHYKRLSNDQSVDMVITTE